MNDDVNLYSKREDKRENTSIEIEFEKHREISDIQQTGRLAGGLVEGPATNASSRRRLDKVGERYKVSE